VGRSREARTKSFIERDEFIESPCTRKIRGVKIVALFAFLFLFGTLGEVSSCILGLHADIVPLSQAVLFRWKVDGCLFLNS